MRVTAFWIGAAVILLVFWLFLPMDAFYSGDSGVKLIQAENLISKEYTDLSLDYNGRDIDPDSEISPFLLKPNCFIKDGRNYSVFPILFPFLSSFPYAAVGYAGLYVLPLLSAFGTLILVYSISRRFLQPAASAACMCAVLFATPVFFYSLTYSEHVPAVSLVLLSIFLFLKGGKGVPWGGIALGAAIWFRSEIGLLIPILFVSGLSFLRRRKDITRYALFSLVPLIALLGFNKVMYGEWLGHVMRNLKQAAGKDADAVLMEKGANLWRSLVGLNMPQLVPQDEAGWGNSLALVESNVTLEVLCFAAILSLLLYGLYRGGRVKDRKAKKKASPRRPGAAPILVASAALAVTVVVYLVTTLFDNSPLISVLASGGIFSFSAFFSIALLLPIVRTQDREARSEITWMLVSALSFVVVASLSAPNDGGIRYGARYLLPVMPLLGIVSFIVYRALQRRRFSRLFRIFFIALILCSLLVQLRGYQILYHKKSMNAGITRTLLSSPAERIAMQVWWMIFNTAPVAVTKKVHILRDTRYLAGMIENSRRVGNRYITIVLTKRDTITEQHPLGRFFKSQNVRIYRQKHVVDPFDTYFNFTVVTIQL